jgi:hypothetical protein
MLKRITGYQAKQSATGIYIADRLACDCYDSDAIDPCIPVDLSAEMLGAG